MFLISRRIAHGSREQAEYQAYVDNQVAARTVEAPAVSQASLKTDTPEKIELRAGHDIPSWRGDV